MKLILTALIGIVATTAIAVATDIPTTKSGITNEKVKTYHTTEQITVCGWGYDSPNPVFEFFGSNSETRHLYPYPLHNYHLRDRRIMEIDLVVMENEYLRVSFSPDFGGRLWSALDKRSGEEMFFHNNSCKAYLSGCGGGYMGAGMELNYPEAHSITNVMPRKVTAHENKDGSVTVVVSEWERVYRTQWQVSFTLRPGEARIQQHILFYNRSHLPGRYRYWSNAASPVSENFRFIYPEKMASEHGGENIFTWPNHLDNDWSYYKNQHEILGLYYLEAKDDFFGYYDSGRDFGVVHHGNRHRVPGKKLWSWGHSIIQQQRIPFLSEGKGPYGEIQSGRPYNQEHFEFIMPQEVIHWEECWYPVKGLDDFYQATDNFAVSLKAVSEDIAVFKIFANSVVRGVTALITANNSVVAEVPLDLQTQELHREEIKLNGFSAEDILITFVDSRKTVFEDASLKGRGRYKNRKEVREEPVLDVASSYSLYMTGAFNDMIGREEKAADYYGEALKLDQYNPEPMRNLAVMMLRRGLGSEAGDLLERALESNKWDGWSRYYLGYANMLNGDIDRAYDEAGLSAGMYGRKVNGEVLAAEALGRTGRYEQAVGHLDRASENALLQMKLPAMKSAFLRNLGREEQALAVIEQARTEHIEEILLDFEEFFLGQAGSDNGATELADALDRDPYRFLEAALDYISMGLYDDAEKVCSIGIDQGEYLWRQPIQL
ncbi:MAG: DUF5107 domain-containing protein, partial [Anaerolineales bacterium]|nr:DUF5107 domain-containing protein [Anaerolineales bacterium]